MNKLSSLIILVLLIFTTTTYSYCTLSNNDSTEITAHTEVEYLEISNNNSWENYNTAKIVFIDKAPKTNGSKIYLELYPNPEEIIEEQIKVMLSTLYDSPNDSIPIRDTIKYILKDYKMLSNCVIKSKGENPPKIEIQYSTQYIEVYEKEGSSKSVNYESMGILLHELTHAYQFYPKNFTNGGAAWAMSEGIAESIRILNGYGDISERKIGGKYSTGYTTTAFFFIWLMENYDKDFIKKMNRTATDMDRWSFDGAIKLILGEQYNIDILWEEYQQEIAKIL